MTFEYNFNLNKYTLQKRSKTQLNKSISHRVSLRSCSKLWIRLRALQYLLLSKHQIWNEFLPRGLINAMLLFLITSQFWSLRWIGFNLFEVFKVRFFRGGLKPLSILFQLLLAGFFRRSGLLIAFILKGNLHFDRFGLFELSMLVS